jgi:ribosomal protein S21
LLLLEMTVTMKKDDDSKRVIKEVHTSQLMRRHHMYEQARESRKSEIPCDSTREKIIRYLKRNKTND